MVRDASYRRWAAGAGLVLTAPLMAVAMGTNVPFSGDGTQMLETMADAGGRAWLSALTYLFAQLTMIVGALGVAHLLRGKAPLLSSLGATLAVVGAFGHTVHGGSVLLSIQMAQDRENLATHAAVLDDFVSSPAGIFSALGLVGTVVGLVVLTLGIWRAGLGPRWVAPALAAFIVLEFAGSAVSTHASVAAGAMYIAAFMALALTIWRSPLEAWQIRIQAQAQAQDRSVAVPDLAV